MNNTILKHVRKQIDKNAVAVGDTIYFKVQCGRKRFLRRRRQTLFSVTNGVLHCPQYDIIDGKPRAEIYETFVFLDMIDKLVKIIGRDKFQVTYSIGTLTPLFEKDLDKRCEMIERINKHG